MKEYYSDGVQILNWFKAHRADFFQKKAGQKFTRGEIEMESAMREKFTQNADLKALLLATKKAKLEHISRGSPPEVFNDLMRVRRELQEASSTM